MSKVLLQSEWQRAESPPEVTYFVKKKKKICLSLLLQIANHTGYIKVDWKRVEKDVNKAKKQLKQGTKQAGPELNTMVEKVRFVMPSC